jgi:L-alanine-DL-glutamate epimerase-like enolase superfamily enzyme
MMRLAEWSTYPVHLPYPHTVHWASTQEDGGDYLLLRLVADDGLVGVAEANVKPAWNSVTLRALSVIVEELFIPLIRDLDLADERAVTRALSAVREQRSARSLVESACWDLRSQFRGEPLWRIWGGDPEVPLSWTVTRQPPDCMAEEAGMMVDRYGFRTLKVKTGQGREIDRAALTQIRSIVGPEVQLMTDANSAYQEREVLDHLHELAELGVTVAEDPCRLRPNRAFEKLQAASPIPILVDNACRSMDDAALFVERGAQAISLKTGTTGIGEAQRMAELAHAHRCAAHVANTGDATMGALVALQVQSALPTREYSLPTETSFFLTYAEDLVTERLRVADGRARLPDTPGIAPLVDWEKVRSLAPVAR